MHIKFTYHLVLNSIIYNSSYCGALLHWPSMRIQSRETEGKLRKFRQLFPLNLRKIRNFWFNFFGGESAGSICFWKAESTLSYKDPVLKQRCLRKARYIKISLIFAFNAHWCHRILVVNNLLYVHALKIFKTHKFNIIHSFLRFLVS